MARHNVYGLTEYETEVRRSDGKTAVVFHSTAVVTFSEDTITLDPGGWYTVTTKKRMNEAARAFGLGFGVYQRNHQWYVTTPNGQTHKFPRRVYAWGIGRQSDGLVHIDRSTGNLAS